MSEHKGLVPWTFHIHPRMLDYVREEARKSGVSMGRYVREAISEKVYGTAVGRSRKKKVARQDPEGS